MVKDWLYEYSVVGIIQKPHGVYGEVKVKPETRDLDRLSTSSKIFIANPKTKEIIPARIEQLRTNNEGWIAKFDQIKTREQVPEFRFFLVLTPISDRPQLDDGHFYYSDLENLDIKTTDGAIIGKVIEVLEMPSVESFSCKINDKNILLPWIDECVKEVNVESGYIQVELDFIRSIYDI